MKEAFLVQMETDAGRSGLIAFDFRPGPYGPVSGELHKATEDLIERGAVRARPYGPGEARELSLAPDATPYAVSLWKRLDPTIQTALHQVKSNYNDWSYEALMLYVYRTFDQFTSHSRIKSELLGT